MLIASRCTFVLFLHAEHCPLELGINVMINCWREKQQLNYTHRMQTKKKEQKARLIHNIQGKSFQKVIILTFLCHFQVKALVFCYAYFLLFSLRSCVSLPAHQMSFHMPASPAYCSSCGSSVIQTHSPWADLCAPEWSLRKLCNSIAWG